MLSGSGTENLLSCPQEEAAENVPLLHLVLGLVLVFKASSQWSHMLPLQLKVQTADLCLTSAGRHSPAVSPDPCLTWPAGDGPPRQ